MSRGKGEKSEKVLGPGYGVVVGDSVREGVLD
jgi:hypothetical protein